MKLTNKKTQDLIKKRIQYWEGYYSAIDKLKSLESKISEISELSKEIILHDLNSIETKTEKIQSNIRLIRKIVNESNKIKDEINTTHRERERINSLIDACKIEIEKNNKIIRICYFLFFLIVPLFLIKSYKNKISEQNEIIANNEIEIKELKRKLNEFKNKISSYKSQSLKDFNTVKELVTEYFLNVLNDFSKSTNQEFIDESLANYFDWNPDVWSNWSSKNSKIYSDLCIGKFSERLSKMTFELPATIQFIGQEKTILIKCNSDISQKAKSLLESLIIRISLMLPHQVIFTFLDPNGLGQTFSSIAKDVETRENNGATYRVLESIMEDTQRIISTYGLSNQVSFDSISENILINEKFEIIFAADFPKQYDRREIEILQRIANKAHVAGKYLFIHYNQDIPLPKELTMDSFENGFILDLVDTKQYGGTECKFKFIQNLKPEDKLKIYLIDKLKNSKPPERKVQWDEEVSIPYNSWWEKHANENIETPVGRSGSSDKLDIWFGAKQNEGGRPCAHGMLAAMTGSGKSNLYHVLILGLAIRYSPKELSLYLIDGKDGVEFQPYKNLPHAEFISLKSQPKLSRSILNELIEEKERRNNLFSEHGVNDFVSFRQKKPDVILPRILLLVDEYQELFEGDKDGIASNSLLSIAQQGRSVGIHMLLGSQRFSVVGMLHQSAIMGNIHMRIAMKMALADRQALNEFGKEGKQIISTCNLPGKAVINDQSGDDGANKFGKVAIMTKDKRDELINQLFEKTKENSIPTELLTTNIFHGSEQPEILDNPQLNYLVKVNDWLSEGELENFARKEIYKGGLGEISWSTGHKPVVGWLGQEFNVRGQSNIILRRRRQENILLVGDQNEARFGMLLSLITSFVVNSSPQKNSFYIIDKSIKGTPWSNSLSFIKEEMINSLGIEYKFITKNTELSSLLNELVEELNNRINRDEDEILESKNIFLIATDIENFDSLCQVPNKYGTLEDSELGRKLQKIYTQGSSKGIYSIFAFESVMSMLSVVSKKNIDFFRHRIALQMSEDDSFTYVKRREASKLQNEGKEPICAFYIDMGINKYSLFKPYCLNENIYSQIKKISQIIKNR